MTFIGNVNTSISPSSVLLGGALFANNDSELLVYGGGAANLTTEINLHPLDINVISEEDTMSSISVKDNLWSVPYGGDPVAPWSMQELNLTPTSAPKHGGSYYIHDLQLGIYFNGIVDGANGTSQPFSKMVLIDTKSKTARSVSTDAVSGPNARIGASFEYNSEIGKRGGLVLIGGGLRSPEAHSSSHELGTELVSV